MKKLLSLILAVIMLLSVMPMAYAQRATYSPEIEEYIEDFLRAYAYCKNIYETSEQQTEVRNILNEAVAGVNTEFTPLCDNLTNIEANGRLNELTAIHESLKKGVDEVEKKIDDGEITIVIDFYEYCKCSLYHEIYYSYKDYEDLIDRVEEIKSDKYIAALSEFEAGLDIIFEFQQIWYNEYFTYTQADMDAAVEMLKPYIDSLHACLDGNHPYGEYVSNNDATEEADGTKTATCEFCGATNTITDEGTKLPKEEASFFEMIFDLIKDFFELIFSMFK